MLGTRSCRLPSSLGRSMARPRLMWAGVSRFCFPSFSSKPTFISGIERSALTRANPIRWVKETLPPRARARWLLMTMRLSQSSLTGTDRTLVAVGTVRLASVFGTVRAGAPLRTTYFGSSLASSSAFSGVLEADLSLLVAALFVGVLEEPFEALLPLLLLSDCTLGDFSAFFSVGF